MPAHPSPPKFGFRRVWRVVLWNTLLTLASLILIMAVSEAYLRRNMSFSESSWAREFVPGVGILYRPHTLVRATDGVEFWTESKVNSLGFLEREPLAPEEATESCHIAIIGDSFVEAREVKLANRFPVLLEEFAKRELPELDVTTSAFGRRGTGQIQQIPFYDQYASKMNPDLLVLVFFKNDFLENSSFILNLLSVHPWDPDHPPHSFAQKSGTGRISLHPPDPEFENHRIVQSLPPHFRVIFSLDGLTEYRLLMRMKTIFWDPYHYSMLDEQLLEKVSILRKRPQYASLTADWDGKRMTRAELERAPMDAEPLMAVQEALDFTAFSLDQFQERAERDNMPLVILANETLSLRLSDDAQRNRKYQAHIEILREMADARGIPVIDLYDYAVRLGGRIEDRLSEMVLVHDRHWNATGHRRAAEAVLEYLKQNREICDTQATVEPAS